VKELGRRLLRLMAAPGHFTVYGFGLTVHVPFDHSHERPLVRARAKSVRTVPSYASARPAAT
jgi:hypothetical protein